MSQKRKEKKNAKFDPAHWDFIIDPEGKARKIRNNYMKDGEVNLKLGWFFYRYLNFLDLFWRLFLSAMISSGSVSLVFLSKIAEPIFKIAKNVRV